MLVVSFFSWWYGPGWAKIANSISPRLQSVMDMFSVHQLLRTLFAPWRRIISQPGASIEDRWRAWGDNMFSRVMGFIVRVFVLLAALVVICLVTILTALEIVIWPLLPVAIPGCLIAGLAL